MSIHVNAGKFQKFHYNATRNMEMYGSEQAPEYELSKISANIHILYGTNDRIAPSEVSPQKRVSNDFNWNNLLNIALLLQNIPLLADKLNSSLVTISKFPGYNHIDFTYGRNLKMVHKKMIKVLKRYN